MADAVPVGDLTIQHCCLDSATPSQTFAGPREYLLYNLVGTVCVYANDVFLGKLGGRATVTEPHVQVLRFPAGTEYAVTINLEGFAADCLIVACKGLPNQATKLPYWHTSDMFTHVVGTGTHQRTVTEVPTPPGFYLSCGETLNPPGGTSSWPPHATQEDLQLYHEGKTTWEECFYIVAPEPGTAVLLGLYPGGKQVNEIQMLTNGAIMPMPLGSHAVTAHANSFLWYAWFYCGSALTKAYRRHSTDVATYRR